MTTPVLAPPLSEPVLSPLKKKRVLLVDASPTKRDLRAETMRRLGIEVDCALDINEARSWWRADLYNLVLINVDNELNHRDKFCADVRCATPPQQLAFLVGGPEYLAHSPGTDGTTSLQSDGVQTQLEESRATAAPDASENRPQRWGILEASRRISEVRSASTARTNAMRNRPVPPRDMEIRHGKRSATESRTLDDLLREEMQ